MDHDAPPKTDHEAELIKLRARVAELEAAAARQRAQEELVRTQKRESLSVLAGGIAHDFNNILTGILGNIGLAKFFADDAERARARLTEAELAIDRARRLTQQLLTFAKGQALVTRPLSLRDVVDEAKRLALRGPAVTCSLDLPDDLWPLEADEAQISQAFANLLSNAAQAIADGGTIEVAARNVEMGSDDGALPAGRYLQVFVTDDGVGIPPEDLPCIFDPYFTAKSEGVGLGLATTASIIRRHGGDVSATSVEGKGNTFRLRLPASASAQSTGVRREPATRGRGRILVMDDDETVLDVLEAMLTEAGYRSRCTRDGDEAIRAYRAAMIEGDPFDAVIVDLTIRGGLGGRETCEKLREIDVNVRALVASGRADDPIVEHPTRYGFCGLIVKPFSAQELGSALHGALSRGAIDHERQRGIPVGTSGTRY